MLISEAINLAADHIERHPGEYSFNQGAVVSDDDRGMPACMLARIGQYAGFARGTNCDTVARAILGVSANVFYDRIMRESNRPLDHAALYSTATLPGVMRAYSKKYHGIPQEVRAIFEGPELTRVYSSYVVFS